MNGNCYTYPLILPDVDFEDPKATSFNSKSHALIYGKSFIKDCATVTTDAIDKHCEAALSALEQELQPKSDCVEL